MLATGMTPLSGSNSELEVDSLPKKGQVPVQLRAHARAAFKCLLLAKFRTQATASVNSKNH